MITKHADPIVHATTDLAHATQALTDALAQRERLAAKLRLAEADVVQEEHNAGLAVDRVLAGEATDSKREAAMLADARATVDAVRQGKKRIDQQISDAQAAVTQAEEVRALAIIQADITESLEAVPMLETSVQAVIDAYTALAEAHGRAVQGFLRLYPGTNNHLMLPTLELVQWICAALIRGGLPLLDEFNPNIHVEHTFELGPPIRRVTAQFVANIESRRPQAAS